MAPPVKRGKPGSRTARYFFITRSTTSRPSLTVGLTCWSAWTRGSASLPMAKVSMTLPFSMTSTRSPVCVMTARGLQPTNEVAAEMLAAFDRFEQKRFALAADFPVGGERRFNVGQQAARDGDHVALRGQPSLTSLPMEAVSMTLPFSMTSTRLPVCLMTARGLQPTNE